jgi:signal transduction histidine kinase
MIGPTASLASAGRNPPAHGIRRFPQTALLACLALAAALAPPARTQSESPWRSYRATDGLSESLTTAITVSPRGNLWVKHGEVDAVSQLDGYLVRHIPSPGARLQRVYESRAGKIWSVYPDGLLELLNDQWVRHPLRDVSAEPDRTLPRLQRLPPLLPAEQDRVLVLLPDRLLEYHALSHVSRVLRWARETPLGRFNDLLAAADDGVWIAGANGLARLPRPLRQLNPETRWATFLPPSDFPARDFQRPFEDDDGGITAIADSSAIDRRVLTHFDGTNWITRGVPGENFRFAWRGTSPGQFWAVTASALVRIELGREVVQRERTGASQIYDVIVQPRGVFWLATPEGLFRYAPPSWRSPPAIPNPATPVHAALEDAQGRPWFATSQGLLWLQEGHWLAAPWPQPLEPAFHTRDALFALPNNLIALAAADQLWIFNTTSHTWQVVQHPQGRRLRKVLGPLGSGTLCLQTVAANPADPPDPAVAYTFELFDGAAFRPWPDAPPPIDLGSELFFVAQAQNGDIWLGGSTGPALWREGRWQRFTAVDGYAPEGALAWLEFADGRIWCTGLGKVAEFDGKVWTTILDTLDRPNAMMRTYDGNVWVATSSGLHRHYKEAWASVGEPEGLPSDACFALLEDRSHRLWVGTSRGLTQYFPRADVDSPKTLGITANQIPRDRDETAVDIAFHGRDKWQYTPDDRLLYSYRLDTANWSPFLSASGTQLRNVTPGKHRIEVRALDRNWNFELRPATLDFQVIVPWYRETRILAVAGAGLLAALFFAALAVNRHLQLRRSYTAVEHKVAERTRELEQATQALVHSQKMTALGTLASGIAHDFNNMLSIIRGSAQVIEANLDDHDKVRIRTARIKTVVDQASSIVQAMLGFGRVRERQPAPCNPGEIVEETLRLLGDRFLREVPVECTIEPDLPQVVAVRDLLQQTLLNLILNSADALGAQGRIRISAERLLTLPPAPVLAPAPAPAYVALRVQDNGSGIPDEVRPRIFEPFFTTKSFSSRHGTGLGLYMVYEFAKEMKHGIHLDSAPGSGTTFTLILPTTSPPL